MATDERDEIRIDYERNEVVIGDTAVSPFIEGEDVSIDHSSQMDGYVAFHTDGGPNLTLHLIDRSVDTKDTGGED